MSIVGLHPLRPSNYFSSSHLNHPLRPLCSFECAELSYPWSHLIHITCQKEGGYYVFQLNKQRNLSSEGISDLLRSQEAWGSGKCLSLRRTFWLLGYQISGMTWTNVNINEVQVSGVWLAMCSLAFCVFLSLPVLHGLEIDKLCLISLKNGGLGKGSLEIPKGA